MSQPSPQLPQDFEEMDFIVEEEVWNEYELNDGARIKARVILKKIVRDPNNPNVMSFDLTQAIFVVYAPSPNRGERNNAPRPEEFNTLNQYEMIPTRSDERFNRYRILRTGQLVRVRLTVAEIKRVTDRFDNEGLPFYLVTSSPTILMNQPTDNLQP